MRTLRRRKASWTKGTQCLAAASDIFNASVVLDVATMQLTRPGQEDITINVLGMIDSWSLFAQAFVIKGETSAVCFETAQRGWIAPFGAPLRIFHDAAAAFRSPTWGEAWGRHGTMVCVSAAEAPWQHGSIEVFWRTLRRALRLTWRDLAAQNHM